MIDNVDFVAALCNWKSDKIRVCVKIIGILSVYLNGKSFIIGDGEHKPAIVLHLNGSIYGVISQLTGIHLQGIYLLGGLVLLICRIQYIPETFAMIFRYAFTPNAIIGGSLGYALKTAISQGAKRGLFSNEAGMGSTPHAHALAKVEKPHDQGTVAMVGMFIDTFVVLTLTALVVISTLYAGDGILAHGAVDGVSKTNMAQMAFSMVFGESIGNGFVAICLLFFAFSTIIGWNLFGRINVKYLFGQKADKIYSVLAMIFLFLGSILSNDLVWELTDFFNNLMVIPNVIGLLALGGAVAAAAKAGEAAYKEKKKHKV